MTPRRPVRTLLLALALAPALALSPAGTGLAEQGYPATVALPADFSPEGIAGTGTSDVFYAGSRPGPSGGAVYRGDLRTGKGKVIVPPQPGGASIGMKHDPATGLLWVAGGGTGRVTAYDGRSGKVVEQHTAPAAAFAPFLNDVDVADGTVYVTDSRNARLLVVEDGALSVLPLSGEWQQAPVAAGQTQPPNSANGVRLLPDGDPLLVARGELYRVDPATGAADRLVQAGGPDLTNGDGLELGEGDTLYVVFGDGTDSVSVVDLDLAAAQYEVTEVLRQAEPALVRPTTAYFDGTSLWTVNGDFGRTTPDQEVVRLQP